MSLTTTRRVSLALVGSRLVREVLLREQFVRPLVGAALFVFAAVVAASYAAPEGAHVGLVGGREGAGETLALDGEPRLGQPVHDDRRRELDVLHIDGDARRRGTA